MERYLSDSAPDLILEDLVKLPVVQTVASVSRRVKKSSGILRVPLEAAENAAVSAFTSVWPLLQYGLQLIHGQSADQNVDYMIQNNNCTVKGCGSAMNPGDGRVRFLVETADVSTQTETTDDLRQAYRATTPKTMTIIQSVGETATNVVRTVSSMTTLTTLVVWAVVPGPVEKCYTWAKGFLPWQSEVPLPYTKPLTGILKNNTAGQPEAGVRLVEQVTEDYTDSESDWEGEEEAPYITILERSDEFSHMDAIDPTGMYQTGFTTQPYY